MFIFRPSSPVRIAEAQPAAEPVTPLLPHPPVEQEPFIDEGLPIPDSYDTDIMRALLQDPFRIFVYWQVRESSLEALRRFFSPEDASRFKVALRLLEIAGGNTAYFDAGLKGSYWMWVFPDREYEFELGVRSPEHGFIALVRSNRVRAPRGTISPEIAEETEYRMSPPEFVRVLEASGFGPESMGLTVVGPPEQEESRDPLTVLLANLPEAVRAAVLAVMAGQPLTEELIGSLPEPLRAELVRLLLAGGGEIAAIGLMHLLPELLREVSGEGLGWIAERIHPLQIAPRFFVGGTENLFGPGGEWKWPGLKPRPSS